MLSHEVPLMTAFTFHSKSFLTSRHYHPAEKATFFSSPLQTHYFFHLYSWECHEILIYSLQIVLQLFVFLCCQSNSKCLCFSLSSRETCCFFPSPYKLFQPGIICSRPLTWFISIIQLFSQPVTTCFRILLRKFLHLFFPPLVVSFCLSLTASKCLSGLQHLFQLLLQFLSELFKKRIHVMCQAVIESGGNNLGHYISTGFPKRSISVTVLCFQSSSASAH